MLSGARSIPQPGLSWRSGAYSSPTEIVDVCYLETLGSAAEEHPVGDKSPKSAAKSNKQKATQKAAKQTGRAAPTVAVPGKPKK